MDKQIVLISGGAGFLGSHLADYYLNKGYKVVVLDNLSTGFERNIVHLKDNPDFTYYEHDICNDLPEAILDKDFNIDIVANMASPASPPNYQRLSLETLSVGSNGTYNMLELARKKNAKFFHASTSEVYGDPEVHPQVESYKGSVNCYGPRAMYDEAKRYAEALIYSYKVKYPEVETHIARFFNTYGPRMDADDGRVVSNLVVQAINGENLTIYGDGTQTRSFCYVDDLIEGIARLIETNHSDPINLGNPNEFTIKELANLVLDLTGSKSSVVSKPLPADDPKQRQPDINIAKVLLKWSPKIELKEGLEKTVKYFEKIAKEVT